MALNADARASAIAGSIAAQNRIDPVTGKPVLDDKGQPVKMLAGLQQNEIDQMTAGLKAIFGADAAYLAGAVEVLPNTLVAPAGATVQVSYPAGSGSTTTSSPVLSGKGSIQ